ncbi:MAG: crosslink repair DNA glycosylase YcaQ family protein [Verrucomicrobiota bacterium]
MSSLDQLRKQVVRASLFPACSLADAIDRLRFVQADPIRSPARAQDLILRHRVTDYRSGDLERVYPDLQLEECFLYAYGFLPKELWQVIHPKAHKKHSRSEEMILEIIRNFGPMHPKQIESHIAGKRVRNYWGGFSRTGKMSMDSLHNRGALRIAHRNRGIRVYEVAEPFEPSLSKKERFKAILLSTLKSMGPTTRTFLVSELTHFGYLVKPLEARRMCLQELIDTGQIRADEVDSVEYISLDQAAPKGALSDRVRILAPFDPIVRDRARFEHLWNWTYRFEAYTSKAKRKLGYYAMPVLWRDWVIGWANANVENEQLIIEFGYVKNHPKSREYRKAAKQEAARLAKFLGLEQTQVQTNL